MNIKTDNNLHRFCQLGQAVIETEMQALAGLLDRFDENFVKACEHILAVPGRVIVLGMGKSGHIGNKIAATLASTGTPAFFVHPGEASHGDLGMITQSDVVLAISNSGSTAEIITLLPLLKRLAVPLISMTGNPKSELALQATVHLDVSVAKEACPLGLAPTSSTTATLAMGDALAIALLEARGFTKEDFALSHPGGNLGRRLLLKIDDIMHRGDHVPVVPADATISAALMEMSAKSFGMTSIVDQDGKCIGVFTDGDLRRVLDQTINIRETAIQAVMTPKPKVIRPGLLAAEAVQIMQQHKITALIIINDFEQPIGILHMHDCVRAGVI